MSKKKKIVLIVCIIVAVIIIGGGAIWFLLLNDGGSSKSTVTAYVDSVAMVTGMGNNNGTQNRYSGVVEAQESMDITKDEQKPIKDIFVAVGDTVEIGTPLFEYDTDQTALNLEQARIDLESLNNEITNYNNQVAELQKEKAKAPASEQLSYTTQIQTAQLNAKRSEYNKKSKEAEIEKLENDLTNATVVSEMKGIVKSLNTNGEYDYNTGNLKPFMTIMAVGDYRVKGKVNEQNVWSLMEGTPVLIRSRVDSDVTWTGTISRVDTSGTYEDTESGSNGGVIYYGGGSNGQTSTNYAFYVTPDDADALMLGQHVFIELDGGQEEEKEGIWISSMYLVWEGDEAYAWIAYDKNRLEKRKLVLGDYNAMMDECEVLEGFAVDDYIAFPGNLLEEGMNCAINDGTQTNSAPESYEEMPGDMGGEFYEEVPGDMEVYEGAVIPDENAMGTTIIYESEMEPGAIGVEEDATMDAGMVAETEGN